ncbi:MAG: response regulator [Cyclobacteriaceae bacterium]|nr:response regulator [Cyclobacteriaceae bacterium]MDX5468040.1 response regulator [Cyclobacteriaceae bacterium]
MNDKNPAHVLLVEDNDGDIFLIQEAFAESKFDVDLSMVRNGQEAIDFVFKNKEYQEAKRPDLILLDINIPIFNGHEVLAKIKSDPQMRKIPVIMLTTSSNQRDIDKSYGNNCNAYINKPSEMEGLFQVVLKIEEFWLKLVKLAN